MATTLRTIPPVGLLDNRVALSFVGDVVILMADIEKWTDEEAIFLMEKLVEIGGKIPDSSLLCQYFAEPFGGSASQRKLLANWQEENGVEPTRRVASLTDSMFMRGALTAYSWLIKTEVKPFKLNELNEACEWVCVGHDVDPAKVKEAAQGCYSILGVGGQ